MTFPGPVDAQDKPLPRLFVIFRFFPDPAFESTSPLRLEGANCRDHLDIGQLMGRAG